MKACLILWLAGVGFLSLAGSSWADEAGEKLRPAIQRGLGYLAEKGDAWVRDKSCVSCHHMAQLIWSHLEADQRGFEINRSQLAGWVEWVNDKVDESRVGNETLAQLLLAVRGHEKAMRWPERLTVGGLTTHLIKAQLPDGSWVVGSQFVGMQRREGAEPKEMTERLVALALGPTKEVGSMLEKWEADQAGTVQSVETVAWHYEWARQWTRKEEVEAALALLIQLQHEDGGWGWSVGQAKSDALATGQVLYVLREDVSEAGRRAKVRAVEWLLQTQAADGAWPVQSVLISRLGGEDHFKRADGIYTFWGTAWATLGLLQQVPKSGLASGEESEKARKGSSGP